jgi:hypothetical protein
MLIIIIVIIIIISIIVTIRTTLQTHSLHLAVSNDTNAGPPLCVHLLTLNPQPSTIQTQTLTFACTFSLSQAFRGAKSPFAMPASRLGIS